MEKQAKINSDGGEKIISYLHIIIIGQENSDVWDMATL